MDGVQMLDPRKTPGLAYLIPVAKSPHGSDVSPDGKYIIASGKLASQTTVFEFAKIKQAIEKNDTEATFWGLPVLKYDSVRVAEVPVGNGPLHTQFDDKGFAYTSLFVDSAVAKWRMARRGMSWTRCPCSTTSAISPPPRANSVSPDGHWLVALNKFSKDRYLSVGPSSPRASS